MHFFSESNNNNCIVYSVYYNESIGHSVITVNGCYLLRNSFNLPFNFLFSSLSFNPRKKNQSDVDHNLSNSIDFNLNTVTGYHDHQYH